MTYTPYNSDGTCKDANSVMSDIQVIASKGFTTVRLYATDCSGPKNVGDACKQHGLKMILGIYVKSSGIGADTDAQISTLTQWGQGQWDLVEMVVFGNEAVFNGYTTMDGLVDALWKCKDAFRKAGFNGPITTTEPMNIIQENASKVCSVVDVLAANIHAFFNGQTTAESAGEFVASSLNDLAAVCNYQKEAYCLETGKSKLVMIYLSKHNKLTLLPSQAGPAKAAPTASPSPASPSKRRPLRTSSPKPAPRAPSSPSRTITGRSLAAWAWSSFGVALTCSVDELDEP
jgi:hypothetical protein